MGKTALGELYRALLKEHGPQGWWPLLGVRGTNPTKTGSLRGYHPGDFPQAERIGSATVTLPLFPGMMDADVDRVCTAVAEIIRDNKK